jgi:hypothetical protein
MLCSSSSSNEPTPAIIQFSASAVAVATAAADRVVSSYGRLIGNDSGNGIRLPLTASYLQHHQPQHPHDLFIHQAGSNYTTSENYVQDQSIHSSYPSAGLLHQQQQENSALAAINIMRNNNYNWDLEHQTSVSIVSELANHPHVAGRNKLLPLQTNAPPALSNEQRYIWAFDILFSFFFFPLLLHAINLTDWA